MKLELEVRLDTGAEPRMEDCLEIGPWLEVEERLDTGTGMRLGPATKDSHTE